MTRDARALDEALDHVLAFARERNIAVVPGYSPEGNDGIPVIQYHHSHLPRPERGNLAEGLAEALARLDVALIAVTRLQYTEDGWRQSTEMIQTGIELHRHRGDQAARTALERVLAETKSSRRHIGTTASIGITVITRNPVVMIEWVEMTDWKQSISDAEDRIYEAAGLADRGDEDDDPFGVDEPPSPPPPPFGGKRARRPR